MQKPWSSYYEAVKDSPPHPSLLVALRVWNGAPGLALDLGCGAGRDTLTLLAQGWRVHAIDAEAEGTFHSGTEVELLLAGWEIVQLNEMEWDGKPAVGEPKRRPPQRVRPGHADVVSTFTVRQPP
jgi:hypothetical protein